MCVCVCAGWEEGAGLGAREQGIQEPIKGGEVRDKNDKYKVSTCITGKHGSTHDIVLSYMYITCVYMYMYCYTTCTCTHTGCRDGYEGSL